MTTATRAQKSDKGSAMLRTAGQDSLVADGLATIGEAADYLKVSRSKVYQMMDGGQLPFCKFGRSRRVPWRALKRFAERSIVGVANAG